MGPVTQAVVLLEAPVHLVALGGPRDTDPALRCNTRSICTPRGRLITVGTMQGGKILMIAAAAAAVEEYKGLHWGTSFLEESHLLYPPQEIPLGLKT
jgi:hypothetical protein